MDTPEYTTLAAPLKGVPDPRLRRGQRYPWDPDHGRLGQGRASWGIGQWVQEHAAELGSGWAGRLPGSRVRRPCVEPCTNWTWGGWKTA
jgi:hypothetical protein